jgi:hypothetical protein
VWRMSFRVCAGDRMMQRWRPSVGKRPRHCVTVAAWPSPRQAAE